MFFASATLVLALAFGLGWLETESVWASLAIHGGLMVGLVLARWGVAVWQRGAARRRFEAHLGAMRDRRVALEEMAAQFESHHRPPRTLSKALGQAALLEGQLDEADPLALWIHINGDWHAQQAQEAIEGLRNALSAQSDEPMAFKTQIQQRREAELSKTALALAESARGAQRCAARHARVQRDVGRFALGMVCLISALWALGQQSLR